MKYLKLFEDIKFGDYSVGDIITCINNRNFERILNIGDKYLVRKIYDHIGIECKVYNREFDLYYNKNTNNQEYYVDVVNIKDNQTATEVYAHRFAPELEYNINKYNV